MLEFINNNGVLFSGVFGVITSLITAIVAIIVDNRKSKADTIRGLKKELSEIKKENDNYKATVMRYQMLESDESNIDKSRGSIYSESLPNGKNRTICGYCWEKDHIKIPIVVDIQHEEYTNQYYFDGYCQSCKTHCIENIEHEEELPF